MKCYQCNRIIEDYELICPHCGFLHDPDVKREEHKPSENIIYNRDDYHVKGKRGIFAILSLYKNTFNFLGVADRGEYWTQLSFITVLYIIGLDTHNKMSPMLPPASDFTRSLYYFSAVMMIISIIPIIAATVRRLHDAGKTGMWYFINFIPLIGGFVLLFLLLMPYERNQYNRDFEKSVAHKDINDHVNYDI